MTSVAENVTNPSLPKHTGRFQPIDISDKDAQGIVSNHMEAQQQTTV